MFAVLLLQHDDLAAVLLHEDSFFFAVLLLQHDDLAADLLLQASFSFFEQDDFFAELEQFAFP